MGDAAETLGRLTPPIRPGTIVRSLGLRTDLLFHRFDGVVIERESYVVVKTPANPGFFFGNFLLFAEPPDAAAATEWPACFAREFAGDPAIRHVTLIWDTPEPGDIAGFAQAGFEVETALVLTARSVRPPPKLNDRITIRPITGDAEWRAVIESQILSPSVEQDPADYRLFKERQFARYRAMADQGLGFWFGAWIDHTLVGDLGLFRDGDIGRFQLVETHPDHRRQGICGTLVHQVARFGFETMGLTELLMVADEAYHAAAIYQQVGFLLRERHHAAFRWERG